MIEPITGETRVFGIIADPISQVQTPQLMNALMRARGINGVLVPMHVASDDLPEFLGCIRGWRNFGGFIATVPHKTSMVELCNEVSDRARCIGAANIVRRDAGGRLIADMLDGLGFVQGLLASGIEPRDRKAYLAGAGGAANAIAFGLAEAGIASLTIGNRTAGRAKDLKQRLASVFPALGVSLSRDPAGHEIAINATSLGMRETDPLPIDVDRLDHDTVVVEIIMKPETTPLLAAAKAKGLRTHPGKPMLESQIALMANFLGISG